MDGVHVTHFTRHKCRDDYMKNTVKLHVLFTLHKWHGCCRLLSKPLNTHHISIFSGSLFILWFTATCGSMSKSLNYILWTNFFLPSMALLSLIKSHLRTITQSPLKVNLVGSPLHLMVSVSDGFYNRLQELTHSVYQCNWSLKDDHRVTYNSTVIDIGRSGSIARPFCVWMWPWKIRTESNLYDTDKRGSNCSLPPKQQIKTHLCDNCIPLFNL